MSFPGKTYVKFVKSKLANCSIFYKGRSLLNVKSLSLIYFSLLMPHTEVCSNIWGNADRQFMQCITSSTAFIFVHSTHDRWRE